MNATNAPPTSQFIQFHRISAASYWISCFRCFTFSAVIIHIRLCLFHFSWSQIVSFVCVRTECLAFTGYAVYLAQYFQHLSVTYFLCLDEALISIFGNLNEPLCDDVVCQMLIFMRLLRFTQLISYTLLISFKMFTAQPIRTFAL